MRKLSFSVLVALVTFAIGLVVAAIWLTQKVPELKSEVSPSTQCYPLVTQKIESLKSVDGDYFPKRAFYQDQQRNDSIANWYGRYLAQMKEPSLFVSQSSSKHAAYRFLWVRSFHPKVAIFVWTDGERKTLSVKQLSLEEKNKAGQLTVNETRSLTEDEWAGFSSLVNETCFWKLSTVEGDAIAMDGAWWVLEGSTDGYYHVVTRQSPVDSSYRELCLYMLKLSGLKPDASKNEIY